jgi:hypothetical protein
MLHSFGLDFFSVMREILNIKYILHTISALRDSLYLKQMEQQPIAVKGGMM